MGQSNRIKEYLKAKRLGKDANRLERDALHDPFLDSALDGYASTDQDSDLLEMIQRLEKKVEERVQTPKRKTIPFYWWVASCFLVLLSVLTYFTFQNQVATPVSRPIVGIQDTIAQKNDSHDHPKSDGVLKDPKVSPNQPVKAKQRKKIQEQAHPSTGNIRLEVISSITDSQIILKPIESLAMKERQLEIPLQIRGVGTSISPPIIYLDGNLFEGSLSSIDSSLLANASINVLKDASSTAIYGSKATNGVLLITTNKAKLATQKTQNTRLLTGTIKDERGERLVGVNVRVSGTEIGTVSDIDGEFQLTLPDGITHNDLEVSYIGYKPLTQAIAEAHVNIQLKDEQQLLSEVVVVGYGVSKKSELTGSISGISSHSQQASLALRIIKNKQNRPQNVSEYKSTIKSEMLHYHVQQGGLFDGKVKVRFDLDTLGYLTNIRVIRSDNSDYSDKLIELLQDQEPWKVSPSEKQKRLGIRIRFIPKK